MEPVIYVLLLCFSPRRSWVEGEEETHSWSLPVPESNGKQKERRIRAAPAPVVDSGEQVSWARS